MTKSFIFTLLLLHSIPTWACWYLKGTFETNGKRLQINQKINHDKPYSFQQGNLIAHVTVPAHFNRPDDIKDKKDAQLIQVELIEKNQMKLKAITKAEMIILGNEEATMIKEDPNTKELIKLTLKLESI